MSFELEFRGALHRYLRSRGYDIYRVTHYDSDFEGAVFFTVGFLDSRGESRHVILNMDLEELMEQL